MSEARGQPGQAESVRNHERAIVSEEDVNILQLEMVVVVCHFTGKMNGLFLFFTAFFFYQRAPTR